MSTIKTIQDVIISKIQDKINISEEFKNNILTTIETEYKNTVELSDMFWDKITDEQLLNNCWEHSISLVNIINKEYIFTNKKFI